MAKLTNIRFQMMCAMCGTLHAADWRDDVPPATSEEVRLLVARRFNVEAAGWKFLAYKLELCPSCAKGYEGATEDTFHILRQRLVAHRVAENYGLQFFLAAGKVVTGESSRPATPEETALWYILVARAGIGTDPRRGP